MASIVSRKHLSTYIHPSTGSATVLIKENLRLKQLGLNARVHDV